MLTWLKKRMVGNKVTNCQMTKFLCICNPIAFVSNCVYLYELARTCDKIEQVIHCKCHKYGNFGGKCCQMRPMFVFIVANVGECEQI